MRTLLLSLGCLLALSWSPLYADNDFLSGINKVLFLGDSITYDGRYVAVFETEIRFRYPQKTFEFLNLGLPSETVSGLSEDGHADGKFPRPTVHERLGRVLDKVKPQLVYACYGMNDGIYMPFSEERFAKYKEGIEALREAVIKSGAKIIHLTPAIFDPLPIPDRVGPAAQVSATKHYEGYGEVLDRYSDWLLSQRAKGWVVYDLHGPIKKATAERRAKDPKFTLAPDGVHPNLEGQLVLAQALVKESKLANELPLEDYKAFTSLRAKVNILIYQRQRTLTDAYLTDIGHKRPMPKGLPLDEALKKAAELNGKIQKILGG